MARAISIVILLCIYGNCYGQSNLDATIGLSWRSTPTEFLNLSGVGRACFQCPRFDEERNLQGFSLNLGLAYTFKNLASIEFVPNLRYDVDEDIGLNQYEKSFLIDYNFNLLFGKVDKFRWGIGYSIINAGATYKTKDSRRNPVELPIDFSSINVLLDFIIKQNVNLEVKFWYVPSNFPSNPNTDVIMFGLRAYKKLNLIK